MKSCILFFAAWGLAASGLAQFPITNVPLHKPFIGMDYSPFLGNESPNDGTYPTVEQITYDITNALVNLAGEIALYSMDGTQSNIPAICAQYNLKCYPCAFLTSDDPADNTNQLNTLIAIANSNYPTTLGLIVGSEPFTLYGYDPQTLISNINYVRTATGGRIPVGTREIPYSFDVNQDVVAACDFLMVDIHPYWGQVPINQAAAWVVQQWQELTNNFPGKKIIVGETGWPTAGTNTEWSNPSVIPSPGNQAIFLSQFIPLANANNIEYFIFEYRDELWKVQEGFGTVEQNWGVVDTNTVKKEGLVDFLSSDFFLSINSPDPNQGAQITVNTYEGDPYYLFATGNPLAGWGAPALGFTGAAGTSQTTVTVSNYLQPGPVLWRAMQRF
jgi:exo-beta-1,3-glucanase (GH17 family)